MNIFLVFYSKSVFVDVKLCVSYVVLWSWPVKKVVFVFLNLIEDTGHLIKAASFISISWCFIPIMSVAVFFWMKHIVTTALERCYMSKVAYLNG